ncbi:hypothetical protein L1987_21114 [Smallanthus sonchifolius]|uniref:Uncharacterized protein n=1 Tax=Smallanthus sonchifolius TaxID=185202 RepID=A0ACB9IUQ1_9ASTR|nr:hypothetical protein L1987_21114 [Smallanthus sonchifolius]
MAHKYLASVEPVKLWIVSPIWYAEFDLNCLRLNRVVTVELVNRVTITPLGIALELISQQGSIAVEGKVERTSFPAWDKSTREPYRHLIWIVVTELKMRKGVQDKEY